MRVYKVQAKIASCGYKVYKNIWDSEKAGDKVTVELQTDDESIKIDPYFVQLKLWLGIQHN